jgi:hypothetical protein
MLSGSSSTDSRRRLLRGITCVVGAWMLFNGSLAQAAQVVHVFTINGDNGETGSGRFVYDNSVVADGDPVARSLADTGDIISLTIELSGGNVIGGTTVFELEDCVGAYLENSPDFGIDINFWCNNGVNSLSGLEENVNYLNDAADFGAGLIEPVLGPSSSTLTIVPGRTVPLRTNSIPATPWWALLALMAGLALAARRRLASSPGNPRA